METQILLPNLLHLIIKYWDLHNVDYDIVTKMQFASNNYISLWCNDQLSMVIIIQFFFVAITTLKHVY
jgi:hypothetical protein